MPVRNMICDGCQRAFTPSGYRNHMALRIARIACKPLRGKK